MTRGLNLPSFGHKDADLKPLMGRQQVCPERLAVHPPGVLSASAAARLARSFGPDKFTCRLLVGFRTSRAG